MARRLMKAIHEAAPEVRVLVGGQGVTSRGLEALPAGVTVAGPNTLATLDEVAAERAH